MLENDIFQRFYRVIALQIEAQSWHFARDWILWLEM